MSLNNTHPQLNRLVAIMGGATALVVCASVGAIVWVLGVSSASLDQTQREGENRLVGALMETYEKNQSKNAADFTAWTELYEDLEGPRHAGWENGNIGPYLATTFGIDSAYVSDKSGKIVYAFSGSREAGRNPERHTAALARLTRLAFRAERPDRQVPVTGIVELDGTTSLATAVTIRDSQLGASSHYSLIELRDLTGTFLGKLSREYGVAGLRVQRGPGAFVLLGPEGSPSPMSLTWKPSDAGRRHFIRVLPTVLGAGIVALLALLALALIWHRITDIIGKGEARLVAAELEASNSRARAAEETSRSKSAFIANMSHELRTPLNAIIGFSEIILSDAFNFSGAAKFREYITAVHRSGHHLLGIVNDILEVSKIEAGKCELSMEPVLMQEAVRDCVRIVEGLAHDRAISFEVAIAPGAAAMADRQALRKILINVVANAVKFSPDGAIVSIAGSLAASECILRITDQGCGIPAATLRNIGKPFVQAESAYSRKYQGTGLGLTICFLLARAMSTSIDLASTEGEGTTVTIRLRRSVEIAALEKVA